ncbi:MAG: tRNA (guanosine(46)-N7)-methyltransferase TrmB, partial [Oscillospiraceae bacterium]|nr:tRNA (guanosine(46)-N7)-methyltransferase TrmB [Oscillospiraceae bacterium]
MRMRKMRNLEPRMAKCGDYRIPEPGVLKGGWRSLKPDAAALWVEVGCGKGKFTAETAQANPDVLLIAVERCREAMVVAMEKAKGMGLKNVFYIDMDVANIEEIFAAGEIDRLFINFPDPWPRKKNAKRRLTHRSFLDKYCRVVRTGGEFHFKTDNASLFEYSVE